LFVTWSLYGALPPAYPPAHKLSAGQAFVWMDRYMDRMRSGPTFLVREEIAGLVVDCLFRGAELAQYELGAFAVMSNHVHVLLLPLTPVSQLLNSIKGITARKANRLLGRTGKPFWQRESY
jgi:putative transposase